MKIFRVGGSCRDEKLGFAPKDFDFVVVGCSGEEEFLRKFPGAEKTGKFFPVYVINDKEYAFARREWKSGEGHTGFTFSVDPSISLMEDLQRRDLTINTFAVDCETGEEFSVPGAGKDLDELVLRHVSSAFSEDPLRVFRVARFACKIPGSVVAKETIDIMKSISIVSLPGERIWGEMEKSLNTSEPHRFFEVLREAGTLEKIHPNFQSIDVVMNELVDPIMRFASLFINNSVVDTVSICNRLKVPKLFKSAAMLVAEHFGTFKKGIRNEKMVRAIVSINRSIGYVRFNELLKVHNCGNTNFCEIIKVGVPENERNKSGKEIKILLTSRRLEVLKRC